MKEISEERIEKLKRLVIDVDDSYLSSDEKADIVCALDRATMSVPLLVPKEPEQPIGYPGQPQVWYNNMPTRNDDCNVEIVSDSKEPTLKTK